MLLRAIIFSDDWTLLRNALRALAAPAGSSARSGLRHRFPSDSGGMLTSIIYTCELNKVNPYDYLIAVQKHYTSVAENASAWLPWNYKHNVTHPPNLVTCAKHQECVPVLADLAVK